MSFKYLIAFTITLCFFTGLAYGQPPPPPATPIDGGLSLVLLAGGLYGLKKITDKK